MSTFAASGSAVGHSSRRVVITSWTDLCMEAGALRSAAKWYELGDAARKDGDIVEAHRAYSKALALEPGHANARYRLGEIANLADERAVAERLFRETLSVSPEHVGARSELNKLLAKQAMSPTATPTRRAATSASADAPPRAAPAITEWGIPETQAEQLRYEEASREKARIDWWTDHWHAIPLPVRIIQVVFLIAIAVFMGVAIYEVATMP